MTKQRQDAWSEENDLLLAETVLRHVREGSTQLNAFEEVGDKLNRTSAACGFRWNAVVRHQYEKALQLAKKQRKQRMRALGNGQPAKKRLLYQPPAVDPEIIQETAAEEPAKTDAPAVEKEQQPLMSGEHMPFVDESFKEELASLSHLLSPQTPAAAPEMTMNDVIRFLQNYEGNHEQSSALKMENERLKKENQELQSKTEQLEAEVQKLEKDQKTIQEDYETLVKIMNRARKLVLFEEDEHASPSFKMDRNGNLEKMAE
ncbi:MULTISPECIES: prespore-specific transcription regulator RsfA [unclassified Bacillus (in: firmicutes)]|uniref:prespore-specific transcription regulator RsfA n=1 Tax=unclassified Bacillus (in: firmicutes) TaxID=185979 RepID=UPI00228008C6|nr:prespore-specific transcription regulator RsfA [Bacillus sp. S20C3]MCY8205296.1 prespore-specific transcription regulator RsfA [Bacillus sp. N12A5]MCY8288296.1 prespore-specific transcription regulator RsfA [Bacillus sp. N13C7]MCY8638507.1 prespore-specific transcription regulator RsfA [Bacillus sp. S17B2]MCY8719201.1 prespore-specific transcription regulator RsfA [Bacillus sp. S10C12M]MCY9142694.1 prespore-specific transcription regulator RsfA [Bacillus sp. T9C1]